MAEAEADQRVPLRYDAEGSPVFEDWDETPVDPEKAAFEAKVAAARAYYDNNDLSEHIAEAVYVEPDVSALIAESDAKVAAREKRKPKDGPVAPVRKTGKQPEKILGTIGAIPVVEDPDVPVGQPVSYPTPQAPDAQTPAPKKRRARKKALDPASRQIEDISDEQLLAEAGVVPFYSTTEAAQFFDRTNQWLYWGLGRDSENGTPVFVHPDGTPIEPERVGDPAEGRRRFTLPIIKDILLSSYRRGNIEPEELKKILRRIRINELGGEWREREGWIKIRGKWVHPDQAEQVNGVWVRKKKEA